MRRKRAVERRSAHGVRALLEHDAAVERWLREEVVAGHMEYMADRPRVFQWRKCLNASGPANAPSQV